jgi:hypothetical protein
MTQAAPRSLSRAVAAAVLALLPAYCSISGLVTGDTAALSRHAHSHAGAAGVVTAIAYGLFAVALLIAAARYIATAPKRRAALFKWAWNVTGAGALLFFLGRFMWTLQ